MSLTFLGVWGLGGMKYCNEEMKIALQWMQEALSNDSKGDKGPRRAWAKWLAACVDEIHESL